MAQSCSPPVMKGCLQNIDKKNNIKSGHTKDYNLQKNIGCEAKLDVRGTGRKHQADCVDHTLHLWASAENIHSNIIDHVQNDI